MKKIFIFIAVFAALSMTASAAAKVDVKTVSPSHFGDIENHWGRHYIERLGSMGIISDADMFYPDSYITRAEALAMFMRINGYAASEGKSGFYDVAETDWYYEPVRYAEVNGILKEKNGAFRPDDAVTRSEAAAFAAELVYRNGLIEAIDGDYTEICMKYGFLTDRNDGLLTRAECAAIVSRVADFPKQYTFYVDPNEGDDGGNGTAAAPYKTIDRAKEEVNKIKSDADRDIYVYLKSGYFRVKEPITFTAEDSAAGTHSIVYSSYGEGNCILSGGDEITGWKLFDEEKNIYRAKINTGISSRQLFINGIRAVRARSNGGLSDCTYDSGESGHTTTDTFLAEYKYPSDLEFVYNGEWVQNRIGVESINVRNGIANIKMKIGWRNYRQSGNYGGLAPAYYENAYELLDEEGEFYTDKHEGYVYYKPRKNEDITTAEVIMPVSEKLINVKGTLDNFVSGISFVNLSFAYTSWEYVNMPHGLVTVQNNILNPSEVGDQSYPTAAVNVSAAEYVNFEKCRFYGLGINGLNMMEGINNCNVSGNEFSDISGTAMCFGDVANKNKNPIDKRITLNNNAITNNYFHDSPAEFQSGGTLTIGLPSNLLVAHNEFYNTPYSAIHASIGWGLLLTSVFKDVNFEDNYFHEINTSSLYDSGAIYTLGGTGGDDLNPIIIKGNYIKNKYRVGGAFYPDEGSSNYLITENVIDLRDVKSVDDHRVGDKACWLFNNPAFSGNIIADSNYVTSEAAMTRTNVLATNTYSFPEADWCPEAQEIIDNSGIEDKYKYLFESSLQKYSVNLPETVYAASGEKYQLDILNTSSRKDEYAPLTAAEHYYTSSDESVARIDENGEITLRNGGTAKVSANVVSDGVLKQHTTVFYVDDIPSETEIKKSFYKLSEGEIGRLDVTMKKRFSRETVSYDSVTYKSGNPKIAEVDENGNITGIADGKTDITVCASSGGYTAGASVEVEVEKTVKEVTETKDMRAYSAVKENWEYDENAAIESGEDFVSLATKGGKVGTAWLGEEKYKNELLEFDTIFNFSTGSWPTFVLRAQTREDCIGSKNTSYLICFKPDVLEVQRFSSGGRYVLCGDINGFVPKVNYGIENVYFGNGEKVNIKVGAIDTEDGVRILCYINGIKAVDVLDDTQDAIVSPGYFGVCDRVNKITFQK